MTRKLIAVVFLLVSIFSQAQTFDTQAAQALTAVQQLQGAAEAKVAQDAQQIASVTNANNNLQTQVNQLQDQVTTLSNRFKNVTVLGGLERMTWSPGSVGANIGGSRPAAFGWLRLPDGSLKLSITANPNEYDDWLTGLHIYNVPVTGTSRAFLDFKMTTDAGALQYAQALETDALIITGGLRYEMSSQINYNRGGMLQVSTGNGNGWHDTGVVLGKMTPDVLHSVRWEYAFDLSAHTVSFVAFTFDGVRYPIPAQFSSLPILSTTWRSQICLQLQQDSNTLGGSYSSTYRDMVFIIM